MQSQVSTRGERRARGASRYMNGRGQPPRAAAWGRDLATASLLAVAAAGAVACQPSATANGPADPSAAAEAAERRAPRPGAAASGTPDAVAGPDTGPNDARGGRLYDNWRAEKGLKDSFVPDASATAELDGKGGPHQNGTLADGAGRPLPNTGHDYRLKNFFGWDLRGSEGIAGTAFQRRAHVLAVNLLTDSRSPDALRAWLASGDDTLPAFGQVLDDTDLADLVAFIVKMRAGELARPSGIFTLDARSPKHYVLAAGGNAARGRDRYAVSCADCHGNDGRFMAIDGSESVGSLSRSSAYEVWFKILNGQPGTDMRRQVVEPASADQEQAILDVLAALCDRTAFPAMAGAEDVPDADPRCSSYLR